jgi:tRNA threonylcarbamoyl adenosine modification protein (Sua5/YciO/YrdC/YwlC family)
VRSTVPDAVEAVRVGGLVVVPTDTVYGIGCAPSNPEAIDRLFEAKRRPRSLVLPVLVDDVAAADRLAVMDDRAHRLAERFWPGALTLVLPRSEESASWSLGEERDTIGLRVPASDTALELLRAAGPLVVTSANLSGAPTLATCEEVRAVFATAVAVYLCADEQIAGRASTVVDVAGGRVLREGDLAEEVAELL